MKEYQMFINGCWVDSGEGNTINNVNPANGEIFSIVQSAGKKEVEQALSAAANAYPEWSNTLMQERIEILYRAADYMEYHTEEYIEDLMAECGSVRAKVVGDIKSAADIFRTAAGECNGILGGVIQNEYKNQLSYYIRKPLGVVLGIAPFNFPMALAADKVAYALGTGNTFILKPSSYTPISGLVIAKCFEQAGLPKGVLNVIPGAGRTVGDLLIEDSRVRMVAFTGSSEVGHSIAKKCGELLKRYCLEMGGKNPMLIMKDYDPELAAEKTIPSAYYNQGQVCMAASRILVEEPIYEEYCMALQQKVEAIPFGDPTKPETFVGPLIAESKCQILDEHIADAVDKGARLLTGGHHQGAFFEPSLLVDVTPEMRVFYEESFGPLVSVIKVKDKEEAIRLCNDNEYGLSSGILTNNIQLAMELAERVEAGCVHINDGSIVTTLRAPFGGVKNSGVGRENGKFSVEEYTELKWITIQY